MRSLWIVVALHLSQQALADSCDKWFQRSGLKSGAPDCVARCVVLNVGMSDFSCPNACPSLCKARVEEDLLFQLSDLYPRLTLSERALVAKHPKQMLKAYRLSWEAEALCSKRFQISATNDESDACRHIVWAFLMDREVGKSTTAEILQAHEAEPDQPKDEMQMDLANNQLGFKLSASLPAKVGGEDIMRALDELFEKKLRKCPIFRWDTGRLS